MKLDILAIGAHPDDVELSCSGTLIMEKKNGKKIGIIDLTRGELGTRGTPEVRIKEAANAATIMNVDVRINLNMADGFFQNDEAHQRILIQAIRTYQPEIVLANTLSDRHPDHGKAAKFIADACFLSGLQKIGTADSHKKEQQAWRPKYVFHYIQDRFLTPSFVYDITPIFEVKIKAIQAYQSQFHSETYKTNEPQTYISTPEFLQSLIDRHRMFGKMIGVTYAEGFISEKILGVHSLSTFVQKNT